MQLAKIQDGEAHLDGSTQLQLQLLQMNANEFVMEAFRSLEIELSDTFLRDLAVGQKLDVAALPY